MSLMLKEILEQPQALERTFRAERAHALEFRKMAQKQNFRLIVLVARGTSDNAAQFGRYLLELTAGIRVSLAALLASVKGLDPDRLHSLNIVTRTI
jgi:glucosamine--fructose-6-phosphate aminotransferase (isomerizing)